MTEYLDINKILQETFVADVEYLPSVDSTNNRAAYLAQQHKGRLPFLIIAEHQTAGRGRGANRWWTGEESLAFSLLVAPETPGVGPERSSLVALATGVAVIKAIAPLLSARQVGLYWPNDIIVDTRKLGGILVEVLPDRQHVIGIGINVNNSLAGAPDDLKLTAVSLIDLVARKTDRTQLLIDILRCLEDVFAQLRNDPTAVTMQADALCLQRGYRLAVEYNGTELTGVCQGIASDGALLLKTRNKVEKIYSGVVRIKNNV